MFTAYHFRYRKTSEAHSSSSSLTDFLKIVGPGRKFEMTLETILRFKTDGALWLKTEKAIRKVFLLIDYFSPCVLCTNIC